MNPERRDRHYSKARACRTFFTDFSRTWFRKPGIPRLSDFRVRRRKENEFQACTAKVPPVNPVVIMANPTMPNKGQKWFDKRISIYIDFRGRGFPVLSLRESGNCGTSPPLAGPLLGANVVSVVTSKLANSGRAKSRQRTEPWNAAEAKSTASIVVDFNPWEG